MGPKLNCRGAMGVVILANVLLCTASHAPCSYTVRDLEQSLILPRKAG